jgi:uncharacterized membrane protein
MKSTIIKFTALFLTVIITGVFWGTWITLTRSIQEFSAEEFIHIGKVIIANVANPMRIIMPLCIVFMTVSVWLFYREKSGGFYTVIVALTLMIVTLLITVLIEVPIDNQIKTWTAATVPGNWMALRAKWEFFHTVRTFTSLASFGFFAWGVMAKERRSSYLG